MLARPGHLIRLSQSRRALCQPSPMASGMRFRASLRACECRRFIILFTPLGGPVDSLVVARSASRQTHANTSVIYMSMLCTTSPVLSLSRASCIPASVLLAGYRCHWFGRWFFMLVTSCHRSSSDLDHVAETEAQQCFK
jgi:hypothetical protein